MFRFEQAEFLYEPYPIGLIKPIMEQDLYDELVDTFPPVELFKFMPKFGNKYTLSEKFNAKNYHKFIAQAPLWCDLHAWVKSETFFRALDGMLRAHYIDVGLKKARLTGLSAGPWRLSELAHGRWPRHDRSLRTRFEFSMLPADGGCVTPHTDTTSKIITLVVSMVRDGEWDPAFGGGTDVNRPKNHRDAYNWMNKSIPFEDIERLHTFEFTPNQCVIFIKTFNSLHSVRPMQGKGSKAMRRSLTINIEKQDF